MNYRDGLIIKGKDKSKYSSIFIFEYCIGGKIYGFQFKSTESMIEPKSWRLHDWQTVFGRDEVEECSLPRWDSFEREYMIAKQHMIRSFFTGWL